MSNECKICNSQINVFQTQKLSDGNSICIKNCRSKGFKKFDFVHATLNDVLSHLKQVEKGTKLWEFYFVPRLKEKNKSKKLERFSSNLYVSEELGLLAITEVNYKFFIFGKTTRACVYRIADLIGYDLEEISLNSAKGETKKLAAHLCFTNTEGMYDYVLEMNNSKAYENLRKYFDKLFGIEKTLGNAMNNFNRQKDAIKNLTSGIKSVIKGDGITQEKLKVTADSLDKAVYGDRSELIKKAELSLKSFSE